MVYHFWNKETFKYSESVTVKPGRIPPDGDNSQLIAWNEETQHLVRDVEKNQWVVKSKKEFTEHLISLGLKSKSDFQKINENGEIVEMSRPELIQAGVISKEQIVSEKLAEISRKAKAKIEGGFRSNAKSGQWYIYDSELEDQFNMQTLVMSGIDSDYRCRKESDGVKDFYPHTNAQLAQIVTEFTQFKVGILQQAQEFRVAISNLTALEMNSFEVNYDLPI